MTDHPEPQESQPAPEVTPPRVSTDADRKNWAMAAHLSALVAFVGVPSLVGPLVVWLMKKDQDEYVGAHAVHALNFNISVLLYTFIGVILLTILGFVTLGIGFIAIIPIIIIAYIAWVIFVIQGALAASRGQEYRYPLTIDFVK